MKCIIIEEGTKPMEMLNIIYEYLAEDQEYNIWSLIFHEFITTRITIFNVIKFCLNKKYKKYKKYSSYKLAQEIVGIREFSEKYLLIVKENYNEK